MLLNEKNEKNNEKTLLASMYRTSVSDIDNDNIIVRRGSEISLLRKPSNLNINQDITHNLSNTLNLNNNTSMVSSFMNYSSFMEKNKLLSNADKNFNQFHNLETKFM